MNRFTILGKSLLVDEKAAEVTELGIVLGLLVALSVAAIKGIGALVAADYDTVTTALGG